MSSSRRSLEEYPHLLRYENGVVIVIYTPGCPMCEHGGHNPPAHPVNLVTQPSIDQASHLSLLEQYPHLLRFAYRRIVIEPTPGCPMCEGGGEQEWGWTAEHGNWDDLNVERMGQDDMHGLFARPSRRPPNNGRPGGLDASFDYFLGDAFRDIFGTAGGNGRTGDLRREAGYNREAGGVMGDGALVDPLTGVDYDPRWDPQSRHMRRYDPAATIDATMDGMGYDPRGDLQSHHMRHHNPAAAMDDMIDGMDHISRNPQSQRMRRYDQASTTGYLSDGMEANPRGNPRSQRMQRYEPAATMDHMMDRMDDGRRRRISAEPSLGSRSRNTGGQRQIDW